MTMTRDGETLEAAPARSGSPYRLDPPRALRAVKMLIRDKEDTAQVFEIMQALSGRSVPKGYTRLLTTLEGGRIAYQRKEIAALLSDDDWLRGLPAGSVGAAYYRFVTSENISAEGLVLESRKANGQTIDAEHPYAWYGRRLRDIHDIWHVLTGYGRDAMGEACLVAFSYAQTRSAGFALIALAGGQQLSRALPGAPVWRAIWQAWRHGANAAWLPGEDYVKLLAEPLEAARARLRIAPASAYLAIDAAARASAMTDAVAPAAAAPPGPAPASPAPASSV
jgi:ubiquinone biosynthesis protein COQ4